MKQGLLILGRQPAIGLAELESLYGADTVQPIGNQAAILNMAFDRIDFFQLGGSIRLCEVLDTFESGEWAELENYIINTLPGYLQQISGKLRLGLSIIGYDVSPSQIMIAGLKLKKVIQKSGHSIRLIPSKSTLLNAAQVIHNRLIYSGGKEIVLVKDDRRTIVARTVTVQDIDSYTVRDRQRPKRDARVGMLPPKLAQIIINLANQTLLPAPLMNDEDNRGERLGSFATILDPFCGTGVLLQEALLMGHKVIGTDIETRMIEYSQANLNWLEATFNLSSPNYKLEVADATNYHWGHKFDIVASETYLGRPFTELPSPDVLAQTVMDCNLILKKFLQNVGTQIPSGMRLCLAVPAWQTQKDKFKHLPLIDRLNDLGYNRVSFRNVRDDQLLYCRENQIVGRELLVLIRK